MFRINCPVKSRGVSPEGEDSLCWEGFVNEVGLEPAMKE